MPLTPPSTPDHQMKAEAAFNHCNEPCVNLYPENEEEIRVLITMRAKSRGIDGNHVLVCGTFEVDGVLESATIVTNQIGHPTTFRET